MVLTPPNPEQVKFFLFSPSIILWSCFLMLSSLCSLFFLLLVFLPLSLSFYLSLHSCLACLSLLLMSPPPLSLSSLLFPSPFPLFLSLPLLCLPTFSYPPFLSPVPPLHLPSHPPHTSLCICIPSAKSLFLFASSYNVSPNPQVCHDEIRRYLLACLIFRGH